MSFLMKWGKPKYVVVTAAVLALCLSASARGRDGDDNQDRGRQHDDRGGDRCEEPDVGVFRQIMPDDKVVQFDQVSWDLELAQVPDSAWGQLTIDPNALARRHKQLQGYINVFLVPEGGGDPLWVAENMHIAPPPCDGPPPAHAQSIHNRRPMLSRYLDLRPGSVGANGPVGAVDAIVLASDQPVPLAGLLLPAVQRFRAASFELGRVRINAEGFAPDPLLGTFPPRVVNQRLPLGLPPQPLTPLPGPIQDLAYPVCVYQDNTSNTECAKNQCVPMAQANAIQYLEDRYNGGMLSWWLPEFPIPGIGRVASAGDVIYWEPVPTNSVVANVDWLTRRDGVFNPDTGGGATICELYRGLFGYLTFAEPYTDAVVRHQGTDEPVIGEGNTCDTITIDLGGRTSTREGLNPTWHWIYDQLVAGRAVTICFGRYDVDGNRTSGHCVRVWGACNIGSMYYLYTLDDGTQGSNNTGLRTQMWQVEDTGGPGAPGVPDGRLNMDGLSWEIEFANSIQALPGLIVP